MFSDKPHGLIVDYIGIGDALREATSHYTRKDGGDVDVAPGVEEKARPLFLDALQETRSSLPRKDFSGWRRLSEIDLEDLYSLVYGVLASDDDRRDQFSTRWNLYVEEVIPAFEDLKAQGLIGAWGITGIGVPQTILQALDHDQKPQAVQVITNLLDSAGGIRRYAEAAAPRSILAKAMENGVPVLGIRAVQAGALTAQLDRELSKNHPDRKDFERAGPYRDLCQAWGEDPAEIAHRYALSLDGVETLILGVKNQMELSSALRAEAAGPLDAAQISAIDQLGLRI